MENFDELEQEMMDDMRRIYSPEVIDHFQNPRNLGGIPSSDGFGRLTGPCGDTMQIYLRVKDDHILDIKFLTDGCGTSLASGSMLTELARGKSIREALRITPDNVLDALGGLPEDSVHCAVLASNTLKEAIKDYLAFKNEPWKRAYASKPPI
jgi:nitrogen fixation NifU-like protein